MLDDIYRFVCEKCRLEHEFNFCFGSDYPDFYFSVPPGEREKRVLINQDLCVIDEEHFFIRGRITIPIKDFPESLVFNVWTSLSKENFMRANDVWNNPDRVKEPPYFGWLQTALPGYANTINIKTLVHTNEVGTIPTVEIIEENHPLQIDQKNGISLAKSKEIARLIIHDNTGVNAQKDGTE